MKVIVILKNGKAETLDNIYNIFWANDKLEIRDIKGYKYVFENKDINGYSIWDN